MTDSRKKNLDDFMNKYNEFITALIKLIPELEQDQDTCRILLSVKNLLISKIEDKFNGENK